MAHGFSNRIWADTATVGTGNVTVGTAKSAHCTPAQANTPDGATRTWLLEEGNDFEIFRGTYTASGTVVQRGTVLLSQIGGTTGTTRMNLAGTATLRCVAAAEDLLSIVDPATARDVLGIQKKNYVVNGAMQISLEQCGIASTLNGAYPVEQFCSQYSNAGVVTVAQVKTPTPAGSNYRLQAKATTADASVASSDYAFIMTRIEGLRVQDLQFGTANAKSIVIAFGVKAPAGTYGVFIRNSAGNRGYLAEIVIAAGEANTDVRKSVVIPGDTTGTWLSTSGIGFEIRFCLMAGSAFQTTPNVWGANGVIVGSSSQFNFMGTVNNTFELFDVGLYEGTVAPPFIMNPYDKDLDDCQRYWSKSFVSGVKPAQGIASPWMAGFAWSTTDMGVGLIEFPCTMRTAPTITFYRSSAGGGTDGHWQWYDGVSAYVDSSTTTASVTFEKRMSVSMNVSPSSLTVKNGYIVQGNWTADARL